MATDIEKIRMLLRDPASASQELSDTDIQTALELESNVYKAAALCAGNLAAKYAPKVDLKAEGVSIANSQKHKHWMNRERVLLRLAGSDIGAPALSGVSVSEMEEAREDTDRVQEVFRMGQFDG